MVKSGSGKKSPSKGKKSQSPSRKKAKSPKRVAKVPKDALPSRKRKASTSAGKSGGGSSKKRKIVETSVGKPGGGSSKKRKIVSTDKARVKQYWPKSALCFKAWQDEAFELVRRVLGRRGWKDGGDVCDPENVQELNDMIEKKTKKKLPKRCLWWVHEGEGRRLKALDPDTNAVASHCIATFLGTDAAVTKIATTQMNNHEDWYPTAYILPREAHLLRKQISTKKKTLWIAKPRDLWAGKGITVYDGNSPEFTELIKEKEGKQSEFVVQTYIQNPLLIGGYKFHFRMYTILTGVCDQFECYLYRDGSALFSTEKYTDKGTMGDNFDPFIHLTNWSINFVKDNPRLHEDKEHIGKGCEWPVSDILKVMQKIFPKFCIKTFWSRMSEICAKAMKRAATWKHVKRQRKANNEHPRFENFGLDLLMDEEFNIFLMESNTCVGLSPAENYFPDPKCSAGEEWCHPTKRKNGCPECRNGRSPRAAANNRVMEGVIEATVDLLQLDCPRMERLPKSLIALHPLVQS